MPDFSEQSVNVPTFGHHPGKGGQEEIVKTHGNGVAELMQGCRVQSCQKQKMSNQKTETEIGVDGGSVTLQRRNTGEDPEAEAQEDNGERATDDSKKGEKVIAGIAVTSVSVTANSEVFCTAAITSGTNSITAALAEDRVEVHKHGKIGQMLTKTRGPVGARGYNSTSGSVPGTCLRVPEHAFYRSLDKLIFFTNINMLKSYLYRNVMNSRFSSPGIHE